MSIQRVLAVVDPDRPESGCADRAAAVAGALGAELHLFSAVYQPLLAQDLFHISGDLEHQRQGLLDDALEQLNELAPGGSVASRWQHPFDEAVRDEMERIQPDLVVLSLRDDVHPSHAEWRLIRASPVPVWLVRPRPWPEVPHFLACVDPTHAHDKPAALDRRIAELTASLVRAFGGALHLLHAAGLTPSLSPGDPSPSAYRKRLETERGEAIRGLLPEWEEQDFVLHFLHTSPVEAIAAFCRERGPDLLVLGSCSRSWLAEALIGHTARDLVSQVDRDLLLVPSVRLDQ